MAKLLLDFDATVLISLVVLTICTITDYKERLIDSRLTFAGSLLLYLIKIPKYWDNGNFLKCTALLILTAGIFYLVSNLTKERIGAGDFHIMFFLIISLGYVGFIECIFYASALGTACGVIKRASLKSAIPLAPLFLFGYFAALIL